VSRASLDDRTIDAMQPRPRRLRRARTLREGAHNAALVGLRAHSTEPDRAMTVLVAHASAHTSIAGIAEHIADRLMKSGYCAAVRPVDQIESLATYQAVVLGSAVHDQAWLPETAAFLRRFGDDLAKIPVWLFSARSLGDAIGFFDPNVTDPIASARRESEALTRSHEALHFRDHRYFAGIHTRGAWSRLGDLFLKICGAAPGDYRNWRDINEWAMNIARELQGADQHRERRRLHVSVRGKA